MKKDIVISGNERPVFNNNVNFCVGTGRMGLALQKEYMDQLKLVQEHIGFKHIRGHGLFTDDMAIFHKYKDESGEMQIEYNFTYLDLVMDGYKKVGLTPFLELGFMPKDMASGEQTVFYWKGNVTPPADYKEWCDMVIATLGHLKERYGDEEVVTWPIEVWNEPNLDVFWKDADMDEYFKLFKTTFEAIKAYDDRFKVGGPAICGIEDEKWVKCFLDFCKSENLKPDFLTRHHYTITPPETVGHYSYIALLACDEALQTLQTTRDIIDSYDEFRGMDIHVTEFNTSYCPNSPLHDTNQNAAYIAQQLSRLGDVNESYSYWTFGDIFEEIGVPFSPFHGGFGLVADGCIPKPTFWTFEFFSKIKGDCIHKSEDMVVTKVKDDTYSGIAWNSRCKRNGEALELDIELPASDGDYLVVLKTVDEKTCNPLKIWHEMGEPKSLSEDEKQLLRDSSKPLVSSLRLKGEDGKLKLSLNLDEFAVVSYDIKPVEYKGDRGYNYERTMKGEDFIEW